MPQWLIIGQGIIATVGMVYAAATGALRPADEGDDAS